MTQNLIHPQFFSVTQAKQALEPGKTIFIIDSGFLVTPVRLFLVHVMVDRRKTDSIDVDYDFYRFSPFIHLHVIRAFFYQQRKGDVMVRLA